MYAKITNNWEKKKGKLYISKQNIQLSLYLNSKFFSFDKWNCSITSFKIFHWEVILGVKKKKSFQQFSSACDTYPAFFGWKKTYKTSLMVITNLIEWWYLMYHWYIYFFCFNSLSVTLKSDGNSPVFIFYEYNTMQTYFPFICKLNII